MSLIAILALVGVYFLFESPFGPRKRFALGIYLILAAVMGMAGLTVSKMIGPLMQRGFDAGAATFGCLLILCIGVAFTIYALRSDPRGTKQKLGFGLMFASILGLVMVRVFQSMSLMATS